MSCQDGLLKRRTWGHKGSSSVGSGQWAVSGYYYCKTVGFVDEKRICCVQWLFGMRKKRREGFSVMQSGLTVAKHSAEYSSFDRAPQEPNPRRWVG